MINPHVWQYPKLHNYTIDEIANFLESGKEYEKVHSILRILDTDKIDVQSIIEFVVTTA